MRPLGNPKFSHCGGRKNRVLCFFTQNLIFNSFWPKNTLETLLNQFMTTKKTTPKPEIRPKQKVISELIFVVLGVLKVKKAPKHDPPSLYGTFWHKNKQFLWSESFPNNHSLSRPESDDSLSFLPTIKDWKKRKMKLDAQIYCLEIQEIDHPISKKYGGLKWMFQWNFQLAPHVTRDFHINPLAFNSTLHPKKLCN